jgi:predicted nucleic acid-binding protein
VKWLVEEPDSASAEALLDRRLLAPDLLGPECANILWKKARRGNITSEQAVAAAAALAASAVRLVASRDYLGRAPRRAVELGHPAYDCLYLAVAADLGLPLVTADARLVRLAANHRLAQVLPLSDLAPPPSAHDG